MTNRIPQEQIEADKLLCDIIRGIMGQVPIDVHLKYILALEESYKEIEKLEASMDKSLSHITKQIQASVDLKSL